MNYDLFLQQHPTLTLHGFSEPRGRTCPLPHNAPYHDRRYDTSTETMEAARMHLAQSTYEIDACLAFLTGAPKLKSATSGRSSYWIKHLVENWHRYRLKDDIYIPNGVLNLSALLLGFPVKQSGHGPNGTVGVSLKWLKDRQAIIEAYGGRII